ncbi:TPA: DUF2683 family protein [Candidatus Woesearchaeota archaeon]|nr:DUF2683 family protein [Candidatus Woesearchaeota archaeon]
MVQALITMSDFEDGVVTIVKGKYGLKNKSDAIRRIIQDYANEELEVRPEFLEKLRKRDTETGIPFRNLKELRKLTRSR